MIKKEVKEFIRKSYYQGEKEETDFSLGEFGRYCRNNILLIVSIIVVALLCYGFELSNFVLSIDEEVWSVLSQKEMVIAAMEDGRWGMAVCNIIFPFHKILPFWNDFISLVFLVVATAIICWLFDNFCKNKVFTIIFGCIFVSMPIHAYVMMFSTVSTKVMFGILIMAISQICCYKWVFEKSGTKYFIWAIISLCFSAGIYQSLLIVFVSITCMIFVLFIIRRFQQGEEGNFKKDIGLIASYMTVFLIAGFLYYVIMQIGYLIVPSRGYVETLFSWKKYGAREALYAIYITFKKIYLEINTFYYGSFILVIGNLAWLLCLVIGIIKVKNSRLFYFASMVLIQIASVIMIVLCGRNVPIRTMQALSIMIPFCIALLFVWKYNRKVKYLLLLVIVICIIHQTSCVTELYYSDYQRLQQDNRIADDIGMKINELCLESQESIPVVYVGKYNKTDMTRIIKDERWGESLLHYTGSKGRDRIQMFMELRGFYHIPATEEDTNKAMEIVGDMPVYPAEGSITYHEGVIVVKLSE